jgi:hypothetical protein
METEGIHPLAGLIRWHTESLPLHQNYSNQAPTSWLVALMSEVSNILLLDAIEFSANNLRRL